MGSLPSQARNTSGMTPYSPAPAGAALSLPPPPPRRRRRRRFGAVDDPSADGAGAGAAFGFGAAFERLRSDRGFGALSVEGAAAAASAPPPPPPPRRRRRRLVPVRSGSRSDLDGACAASVELGATTASRLPADSVSLRSRGWMTEELEKSMPIEAMERSIASAFTAHGHVAP